VGIAAVQLAKARGLEIFGTAGAAKLDFLRKIGVDHPIDHAKDDFVKVVRKFAPDGIEMALDANGGRSWRQSAECLGPTGRLVVFGLAAAASGTKRNWIRAIFTVAKTPRFHPLKLLGDNLSVIGVSLGGVLASKHGSALIRREFEELVKLYNAGALNPVIAGSFPLADAAAAHQFIHDRKNIGKVLLTIK
jgi:NADPH:quinone reductase-like Zn-dependent oxidoreductase